LGKILEALALLKADGHLPLRALVETQVKHMVRGSTVVLITPSIDRDTPLVADYLLQRGLKPVVVLLDVASFGGTSGTQAVLAGIKVLGVPTRLVANGANLEVALSGEYRSS